MNIDFKCQETEHFIQNDEKNYNIENIEHNENNENNRITNKKKCPT